MKPSIQLRREGQPAAGLEQAIVIGGGIAGMAAARALVDHFEEVTVIEGDRFPAIPMGRPGVPQSRHVHVLLGRGQQILEELFPGLRQDLYDAGAVLLDVARDMRWLTPAGWGVNFASDLVMLACTRDLLDWHIRRLLTRNPRIKVLQQAEADELVCDSSGSRVVGVGVHYRDRLHEPGDETMCADLVVDASGYHSKTPQWLTAIGYRAPEEIVVDSFLGYATRLYKAPEAGLHGCKAAHVQLAPPASTRGGLVFPIEGGRMMVTLVGVGRDYPPTDEAGFREFAHSLRDPIVYDFLSCACPLGGIVGNRNCENRWRRYDRLDRWPEGLVVVGDAVCSFNPVYGQGMTTAALGARVLRNWLWRQPERRIEGCMRFMKMAALANKTPWLLATGDDYRVPEVVGGSPDLVTRCMHRYVDQIVRLTTQNPEVRLAFLKVMHMLQPPGTLFAPSILWQVGKQSLASRSPRTASVAYDNTVVMGNQDGD